MENSNNLIKKLDSAINKIRNEDVILPNKPSLIWSYLLRILNTRKYGRFNSSYVKVNNDNNRIITIRFSNHPANEDYFLFNNAEGNNISIVIYKKERIRISTKQSSVYQEITHPNSLLKE